MAGPQRIVCSAFWPQALATCRCRRLGMVWSHLLNVEHFRPVPMRISSAGGLRCWVCGLDYPETGFEEVCIEELDSKQSVCNGLSAPLMPFMNFVTD